MEFKMVTVGEWQNTKNWLGRLISANYRADLARYGEQGVAALSAATPKDTGRTASSWRYEIDVTPEHTALYWVNDNVTYQGDPIAILLQYGHGTGTGGYVVGRDYINPAMKPVFDSISDGVWKLVTGG